MDELEDAHRARWSAIAFLVFAVLSTVAPVLGGALIDAGGFGPLFVLSAALFLAAAAVVDLDPSADGGRAGGSGRTFAPPIRLRTWSSMRRSRHIMAPVTMEGLFHGITTTSTLVLAMHYASGAGQYGYLLAVFGLGGAGAALLTAGVSDESQKRSGPVVAAGLLAGASLAALAFSRDWLTFTLFAGLAYFAMWLALPFNFTAARELCEDSSSSMVGREVYLNCGRVAGILLSAALVLRAGDGAGPEAFAPGLLLGAAAALGMGGGFGLLLRARERAAGGPDEKRRYPAPRSL
jgi:hypothetical protein